MKSQKIYLPYLDVSVYQIVSLLIFTFAFIVVIMALERPMLPQLSDVRGNSVFRGPSHSPRSHFSDLRSLATIHAHPARQVHSVVTFKNPQPFSSESPSIGTTPNYVANQQYRDRVPSEPHDQASSVFFMDGDSRRSSVAATAPDIRRHSEMSSSLGLVTRLRDFNVSSPTTPGSPLATAFSSSMTEISRSQLLVSVKHQKLHDLGQVIRRRSSATPPKLSRMIGSLSHNSLRK